VIVPVLILLIALTVPLAGGRLLALADVRLRWAWLLLGALAVQVLIISVVPHWPGTLLAVLHIASYLMAAAFVVVNRKIPGLWLIALGGFANFIAIAANGGVMPASPQALAAAGRVTEAGLFANSAVVAQPRLLMLGDIFAIPAGWPLASVFSVGDVLIVLGAALALYRICGSRWHPARSGATVTV
jgi:hypothetical protein